MRLLLANWTNRRVGGAEVFIERAASALSRRGHDVGIMVELECDAAEQAIDWPATAPPAFIARSPADVTQIIHEFAADVVYVNGLLDPAIEHAAVDDAPRAVLSAHGYYGACISGTKTWQRTLTGPRVCTKKFDSTCLLHYAPHGCGGLHPIRLARDYALQRARREMLPRYDAVIVHSEHMRQEYERLGMKATCIHHPPPIWPASEIRERETRLPTDAIRLAFVGRTERLKGGPELLRAADLVARALGQRVRVEFAGDGPDLDAWKSLARRYAKNVEARFLGKLGKPGLAELFARVDLLVVPSIWPEPYGMVGLEAAAFGAPSVAFDVGGIRDWLSDRETGKLARAPSVRSLARAILWCIESPDRLRRLGESARARYDVLRQRDPTDFLEATLRG